MRRWITLAVLVIGCASCKKREYFGYDLGDPVELLGRAAQLGCVKSPTTNRSFVGFQAWSCSKPLGPCGCNLQINVATDSEATGTERASLMAVVVYNCPAGTGNEDMVRFVAPLVAEKDRARLREFVTTPKLSRTAEQLDRFAVRQGSKFDRLPMTVEFAAGKTPTHELWIGSSGPEPELIPDVPTYTICDHQPPPTP